MTTKLEIGDLMQLPGNLGRLRYVGDGKCVNDKFIPERGRTGGLTNSGKGKWMQYGEPKALSPAQVAEWIKRKSVA